jgi:hypothetical protein
LLSRGAYPCDRTGAHARCREHPTQSSPRRSGHGQRSGTSAVAALGGLHAPDQAAARWISFHHHWAAAVTVHVIFIAAQGQTTRVPIPRGASQTGDGFVVGLKQDLLWTHRIAASVGTRIRRYPRTGGRITTGRCRLAPPSGNRYDRKASCCCVLRGRRFQLHGRLNRDHRGFGPASSSMGSNPLPQSGKLQSPNSLERAVVHPWPGPPGLHAHLAQLYSGVSGCRWPAWMPRWGILATR